MGNQREIISSRIASSSCLFLSLSLSFFLFTQISQALCNAGKETIDVFIETSTEWFKSFFSCFEKLYIFISIRSIRFLS